MKDVSVQFEQGKKYAVIGESGSGKTTLIKIIMQQLNDYEGGFSIGGQDCRKIDRESFVKHFALIQQEALLFEDTLRNNITMYGEYPEEEVLLAAYGAGLRRYLENLPHGLDSVLGENGANCSGGERQRITIARALLRKASVLVMDEATSSLDEATAKQIEDIVLKDPGLTVISITHHTGEDLWDKYDKVFRMSDGILAEEAFYSR